MDTILDAAIGCSPHTTPSIFRIVLPNGTMPFERKLFNIPRESDEQPTSRLGKTTYLEQHTDDEYGGCPKSIESGTGLYK